MADKITDIRRKEKPSFTSLIEKKRDGGEFSADEIRQIVDSVMDSEMPEAQQAALAMAIFFRQMSAQETAMLAEELRLSGEVIDLDRLTSPKSPRFRLAVWVTRLRWCSVRLVPPLASSCQA